MSARPSAAATPGRVRVFVVDDHPIVRQGLRDLLKSAPDFAVCGEASDFETAIGQLERNRADLVLVDVSLGDRSGFDLIEVMRARGIESRILILSMHDDWLYAERSLRAGASGYVNKTEPADEILEAMRRVVRGGIHVSEEMQDRMLQRRALPSAEGHHALERLTNRELEVLRQMAEGLSARETGRRLGLSPKTVETHRARIKEKLGLETGGELLAYAVRWKLERH